MRKRRKKSKRSRASYVRAGKKAARTRKRRRNPTRHRPVVIGTGRGKKKRLRRSPRYRLKPRRINPRRRGRVNIRKWGQKYFGRARMTNAIMLLVGIGGAGALKGFTSNFMPEGPMKDWYKRLYGIVSVVIGVTLNMSRARKEIKTAGTGMVVFGVYDVLVSNIAALQEWLPVISPPTALAGDYRSYGSPTYMGAGYQAGPVEIVGSNISANEVPEVVGMDDLDLADALDMAA